jgi:predicted DNA-binding protein (MmcQ/YjbR family)
MARGKAPRSAADEILDRLREICFRFPGTAEKLSHGAPSFFVRGKMFAMFADDHHGDDRVAVWLKSSHEDQQRLVGEGPERFFVPPYVGVNGWVGVRLDRLDTDWDELAILVEEGWLAVAPMSAHGDPVRPPPKQPPLSRTDPAAAAAARKRMEEIGATLPQSEIEHAKRHSIFRVRKKVYAYFLDNHDRDSKIAAAFKATPATKKKLLARVPKLAYDPPYLGKRGWVGYRLDQPKTDWKQLAALLTESYRQVAPKGLAAALSDRPARPARSRRKSG